MGLYVGQCLSVHSGSANPTAAYSAGVSSGHTIVLCITGTRSITSIADNAGNTFTVRVSGPTSGGTYNTYIYTKVNCSAVTTANIVTITTASSGLEMACVGLDFNTTDGTADTNASADGGVSTTPSVGPTGTVAQVAEFMVAAFGGGEVSGNESLTPDTSWTAGPLVSVTAGVFVVTEYIILTNASGTYTVQPTLSTTPTYDSCVLQTFKDTATGGVAVRIPSIPSMPTVPSIGR